MDSGMNIIGDGETMQESDESLSCGRYFFLFKWL